MHDLREAAENMGITLLFLTNDNCRVVASPASSSRVGRHSFSVESRFDRKKGDWMVLKSQISGARGQLPGANEPRCAYRDLDLARHMAPLIKLDPSAGRPELMSHLESVVMYPKHLTANQFTRIRRIASTHVFGCPNDNVTLLHVLKSKLEAQGHIFEFSTIHSKEMRKVVLRCAGVEHARERKKLLAKGGDKTTEEILACRLWSNDPKKEWLARNKELLESVAMPTKKYVEGFLLAFKHSLDMYEDLFHIFNLDACSCKVSLESSTLYIVIGMTSNFNIVPLCHVWLCANESEASWSRVLQFVQGNYPRLAARATIVSDRDKGIAKAMRVTFTGRDVPRQFFCAHHRKANLAWFGKEMKEVFDKLLNAKTVEQIANVKNSVDFKGLRDSARDALTSVDDAMQFLAACVAEGGVV